MIEKINNFREYLDYIEDHYNDVQRAWKTINDKCKDKGFRFMSDDFVWQMIDTEVKNHDLSKLSAEEFTQYRQYFHPCDNENRDAELFEKAWEHHKRNNDHHWQTWTEFYSDSHFADAYLVMNIVDWVAMGFYSGESAKTYYENNADRINLPEWAVKLMYEIFDCIYPE